MTGKPCIKINIIFVDNYFFSMSVQVLSKNDLLKIYFLILLPDYLSLNLLFNVFYLKQSNQLYQDIGVFIAVEGMNVITQNTS